MSRLDIRSRRAKTFTDWQESMLTLFLFIVSLTLSWLSQHTVLLIWYYIQQTLRRLSLDPKVDQRVTRALDADQVKFLSLSLFLYIYIYIYVSVFKLFFSGNSFIIKLMFCVSIASAWALWWALVAVYIGSSKHWSSCTLVVVYIGRSKHW